MKNDDKILSNEKNVEYSDNNYNFKSYDILIAEDIESNYKLLRTLLKDHNVSWAINGFDAVNKCSENNYDLILMDIKMPHMNGIEAVKEIRKFNKNIPIIAVTANAFDSDKEEALREGFNDFVTKPLRKDALMNILQRNILINGIKK